MIILGQEDEIMKDKEELAWDREMAILKSRNLYLGLMHLFSGLSGFYLGKTTANMKEFRIPISTIFLDWNDETESASQKLEVVHSFEFVVWTSMFALMSAAAHFIILWQWDSYVADLKRGLNRYRWWEYAISSSLMIVLIAMLFGVYDLISLIFIASINGAMNLFGDVMELRNAGKAPEDVDWTPFIYGGIAGLYSWVIIFAFMVGSPGVEGAPWFVWAILVTYIVLFCTFPWTMYNQYAQNGRYNNALYPDLKNGGYIAGEKMYGFLSLVAKTMLVWLVISGSNQPSSSTVYN